MRPAAGIHPAGAHQEVEDAVRRHAGIAAGGSHEAGDEDADALGGQHRGIDLHLGGVDLADLALDHLLEVAHAGAGDADRADIRQEEVPRRVDHADEFGFHRAPGAHRDTVPRRQDVVRVGRLGGGLRLPGEEGGAEHRRCRPGDARLVAERRDEGGPAFRLGRAAHAFHAALLARDVREAALAEGRRRLSRGGRQRRLGRLAADPALPKQREARQLPRHPADAGGEGARAA